MPKRRRVFNILCAKGKSEACYELGQAYIKGDGVEQDIIIARSLLEQSCEQDFARACSALARSYAPDELDLDSRIKILAKGCELDDEDACFFAGLYLMETPPHDRANEAIPFLERACEQGYDTACHTLGRELVYGFHIESDVKRGKELLETTCKNGHKSSCSTLELLEEFKNFEE